MKKKLITAGIVLSLIIIIMGCGRRPDSAGPQTQDATTTEPKSEVSISTGVSSASQTQQVSNQQGTTNNTGHKKIDSDIMERYAAHIIGRDEDEMVYDASGNLIKVLKVGNDGNKVPQYEFTYDSAGRVYEIIEYSNNNPFIISTYKRNAQGQKTEIRNKTSDGKGGYKNSGRTVIEYDSSGNRISDHPYFEDGTPLDTYRTYLYDNAGNRTEYQCHNTATDEIFVKDIYEYDANGRIISATSYSKGVEGGKMVYEYEGNRFKQMTIYTSKDDKVGTTGYTKVLPESLYELQDY